MLLELAEAVGLGCAMGCVVRVRASAGAGVAVTAGCRRALRRRKCHSGMAAYTWLVISLTTEYYMQSLEDDWIYFWNDWIYQGQD